MGVITLAGGVGLFGRCVDSAGVPVGGINLDVIDVPAGTDLLLKGAASNAFGNFAVAVPTHAIEVDFDPIGVVARTLVPRELALTPSATVQLGDVAFQNGWVLGGTVRNASGLALSGIDLDVFQSPSGTPVFTPQDTTDTLGVFSMVLAPGTYDVELCPALARRLVATQFEAVVLSAHANLGLITLANGVVLSGTVRAANGLPVAGADVNVRNAVSGLSVFLCGDNTNAVGQYAVVVPSGTLNVGFALPGQHGTSGEDLHDGLVISGDTVVDGTLPAPTPDFSGAPRSGVGPLGVTFTDLSSGALTGWAWNFGDGGTSTAQHPQHTYTASGAYTVELVVSGPGGPATSRKLGYVNVLPPPPVASFTGSPTSGLAPLVVGFTNQSTGSISTHAWAFGDGTTSSLASPTHTYASAGVYSVSLTETGTGGSSTLTRVDYVVVTDPAPVAEFTATPLRGGAPLSVAFEDLSNGAITSWSWDFGDGKTSTLPNPTHVYRQGGFKSVRLTVAGPGGVDQEFKLNYIAVRGPLR
jgi:PKD repeat protein